jgi:CheY-like chemotaxis protein
MKKSVILIDDNAWEHAASQFKSVFALYDIALETISAVDDAHKLLKKRNGRCPCDLFVIDIMMPAGSAYQNEETHDDLITGLLLARDIRARYPLVPIILWSGTSLNTVRFLAAHMQKRLSKCIFLKKPIDAETLAALVDGYFKKGSFAESWVKRIWAGIVLRPAIGGIGLDLKKFLDGESSK